MDRAEKPQGLRGKGDKLTKIIEVPPGSVTGGAHIEINSNREMLIEGCRGVLTYTGETIRASAGEFVLEIAGREMLLRHLSADTLLVEGHIASIRFEPGH